MAPFVLVNLQMALTAIAAGLLIGFLLGWARVSGSRGLRALSRGYTELIRGTPLLIQIFFVFFLFPAVNRGFADAGIPIAIQLSAIQRVIIALTINTSAYQAEIFRAGFQSIRGGQIEAATSIGMTKIQTMLFVIVPQAFRVVAPPLTNEYIIMFKDATPLAFIVAILELMRASRSFAEQTQAFLFTYFNAALIFLALSLLLTLFLRILEARYSVPGLGISYRAAGG